jgi:Asp/Glu/hydantoin racemase
MVARTVAQQLSGFIGVLMLDTQFERILGDAGNMGSYHMPARARVVARAGSLDIVRDGLPSSTLVAGFCDAARALEAEGAVAITSTCGFLVTVQDQIARAVSIPVMVSALSLFPTVRAAHGGRPIGVLTASARSLGRAAQAAAGIGPGKARIVGMEDCAAFTGAILVAKEAQPAKIDHAAIEAAVVAKVQDMLASEPDLGAFLLECGNLPPYAGAIQAATGKPVYSILDAARLLAP